MFMTDVGDSLCRQQVWDGGQFTIKMLDFWTDAHREQTAAPEFLSPINSGRNFGPNIWTMDK